MVRKILLFFLVLTFALPACKDAGGGCAGLFRSEKGGVPVMVAEVKVRDISPIVTVSGKLVPNNESDISYPYDVKIQEVYVQTGSVVVEGAPLFRLAEDELTNNANVARARKAELEALLDKNKNLVRGRERSLEEGKIDQLELARLEKEIAVEEAELERLKAEIVRFTYSLEYVVVGSPIAGMVTKKNISAGMTAAAGTVLISIMNVNPVIVSFALSAEKSSDIAQGAPLKVLVDEVPGKTFNAVVVYVSPELHVVGKTFEVWASIPNDDLLLKAGMGASTEFVSDVLKHTYVIPVSSILSIPSHPYVYKVNKGVARKTPVIISAVTNDEAEIVDGLAPGDIVVVKGAEDLFEGASVNIWR